MKKVSIFLLTVLFSVVYSQVTIGKSTITNTSVSLEFGNIAGNATTQKGVILPWVTSTTAVTDAVPGTFIFDSSDKKIKYYKYNDGTSSNIWFDLSVDNMGIVDTSLQNNLTENTTAKTTIGAATNVPGILVLEDTNKAMILPLVDKYSSVVNPSPGMMVYDLANNMLCVFNGTVWTFWKS